MNKISINHGSFKLDDIDLDHGTLTVGRAADNDVQLDDAAVSSHHAKIVTFFNVSYIEDLDSTNGTIVNGRKVKKYTLHTGDILLLGKHQLLFTGSKVQQGHDAADSTIVMTQSDLTSALATATDAKPREHVSRENGSKDNSSPASRAPSAQSNGSRPAMEAPKAIIPQHQTTSRNHPTPGPIGQKAPIPESRPTQTRANPAARPIPSRLPTPSPFESRVKATSGMSYSMADVDDDEPLDEIFKDFVTPPPAAATPPTTPQTTRSETAAAQPAAARSTAQVSNKENRAANGDRFAPFNDQFDGNANQRMPTGQDKPAHMSSFAPQKTATNYRNMDAPAVVAPETSSPPPASSKRRIVVEDPSVLADDRGGRIYNVSSGISETDRSAEYLNRAFGSKGGHQEIPAVGDKTLLRQIITGDRDFNPSRNKFEIIQIVLGFVIFAIIALIAFSNF